MHMPGLHGSAKHEPSSAAPILSCSSMLWGMRGLSLPYSSLTKMLSLPARCSLARLMTWGRGTAISAGCPALPSRVCLWPLRTPLLACHGARLTSGTP